MKIVTAASWDYKTILNLSLKRNKEVGYEPIVYNIENTIDIGKQFNLNKFYSDIDENIYNSKINMGMIPYKPYIIKEAILEYKEKIVWLDCDAFCIGKIDDVFDGSFDIAVTMRRQDERNTLNPILNGLLNTGVVFINNTDKSLEFIDLWIKELKNTIFLSDQEAINRLILQCCELKEDCYNNIYNLNGIRIKILKTEDYNYFYYPNIPKNNTKILHLKTNLRYDNEDGVLEWFKRKWINK